VTSALVTYPAVNPRAALFDPARWALVYRARDGLVFARRRPEFAALIAARELPITFARGADGAVEALALEDRPAASPAADCAWRQRLGDFLVEAGADARAREAYRRALACLAGDDRRAAALALGDVEMRLGDRAAAAVAYGQAPDAEARGKRGLALLALGRAAEALDDLAAARAARPGDPDARLGEGLALAALGRRAEAAAALRAFLTLAPAHVGAARARAELARLGSLSPPRSPAMR
jgi:tetratricopeptide (TPR) repeat protein